MARGGVGVGHCVALRPKGRWLNAGQCRSMPVNADQHTGFEGVQAGRGRSGQCWMVAERKGCLPGVSGRLGGGVARGRVEQRTRQPVLLTDRLHRLLQPCDTPMLICSPYHKGPSLHPGASPRSTWRPAVSRSVSLLCSY